MRSEGNATALPISCSLAASNKESTPNESEIAISKCEKLNWHAHKIEKETRCRGR